MTPLYFTGVPDSEIVLIENNYIHTKQTNKQTVLLGWSYHFDINIADVTKF